MEVELKYSIPDREMADEIWESELLRKMEDPDTRESLVMKAVYFDTEDCDLRKRDIAFRVRTEGSVTLACLKWGGKSENGLHSRQEINVPVSDEACLLAPSLSLFRQSETVLPLIEELGDKPLINVMEILVLRRRLRIDHRDCIVEFSLDTGEIVTEGGTEPICEMELELFSGSEEDLLKMGEEFCRRWPLAPEDRPKYVRGLALLERSAEAG